MLLWPLLLALSVILCCHRLEGLEITAELSLPNYDYSVDTQTTCAVLGFDYFDSSRYECQNCPHGQSPDPSTLNGIGDATSCMCSVGYVKHVTSCAGINTGNCTSFNCTSCLPQRLTAYSDHSGCVGCDHTTLGLQSASADCACPAGQVLLETDQVGNKLTNKTCSACANGTLAVTNSLKIAGKAYSADLYTCQQCPDTNMAMSLLNGLYSCKCAKGYTITGIAGIGQQSCLLTDMATPFIPAVTSSSVMTYKDAGITLNSLTFQHYYLTAASRCTYGSSRESSYCQLLANLCVLQLYEATSIVCENYQDIISVRNAVSNPYSIDQWVQGMPWIAYNTIWHGQEVCETDIYTTTVSLRDYTMQYVIASYALNGSFLGYSKLDDLLAYCTVPAPHTSKSFATTKWQLFATNKLFNYDCDLKSLLMKEQVFYEIFLFDPLTSKYAPVPVRILNHIPDESQYEQGLVEICHKSDVLVRRFMLFDVVSGISEAGSYPEVIRYASYFGMAVGIVKGQQSSIYPPVFTVEYTESSLVSWTSTVSAVSAASMVNLRSGQYVSATPASAKARRLAGVPTSSPVTISTTGSIQMEATYISDLTAYFSAEQGCFIAAFIIAFFVFMVRYNNWRRRNSRLITAATLSTNLGAVNMKNIVELMLMMLHSYLLVMFPFILLVSWYFFVFFKLQSVPSLFLPPINGNLDLFSYYSPYQFWLVHMYLLAFIQTAYVFVKLVYNQSHADLFFIDWEPIKDTADKSNSNHMNGSVSVWRSILVANEYAELQTLRRSDIHFTLFWLGFFLIGLNLQYNATMQPSLADLEEDNVNLVLRFANSTFFWLVIASAQYVFKYFILERYLGEPPEQTFLDFCTIAKISILVLDEQYHGYYMHCRSPFQYADGNMLELIGFLQQEEAGLTVDRALDDGPSDVQTFQLFLSSEWRAEFDKHNTVLSQPLSLSDYINNRRQQALSRQAPAPSMGFGGFNFSNLRKGSRANAQKSRQQTRLASGLSMLGLQSQNVLPNERVINAWKEMNTFLMNFVENNYSIAGMKRMIREPSYFEKSFFGGPELTMPEQPSVLLTDREMHFTKTLFLGNEADLLLFNILSYSLFDIWFNNTMVSILLGYLLNQLFVMLRHQWGEEMISSKTLVDRRFLI